MCTAFTTMLYVGSDIDVQPLTQLRPWEKSVIFVDNMMKGGLGEVKGYIDRHAKDSRLTFRETTDALRQNSSLDVHILDRMLEMRLKSLKEISNVHHTGQLRFNFTLYNVQRTLELLIESLPESARTSKWSPRMLRLRKKVSTIVSIGLGMPIYKFAKKVVSSSCNNTIRIICGIDDKDLLYIPKSHYKSRKIKNYISDSLAGYGFDVLEMCLKIRK